MSVVEPLVKPGVQLCGSLVSQELEHLAHRFGVEVSWVDCDKSIPGSYWGDVEAGLVGSRLYVRSDTPVHSALHELCHYVCMDAQQRSSLDTNAGGDYDEENAVCYLQIVLADHLRMTSRLNMMRDMDLWGYTFRLGSARAWFEKDADEAQAWLVMHNIIDQACNPTWCLRQ